MNHQSAYGNGFQAATNAKEFKKHPVGLRELYDRYFQNCQKYFFRSARHPGFIAKTLAQCFLCGQA